MIISLIAVVDENMGIGINGKLLCHLPADLKLFKKYTTGHPIIMGRRTFESISSKPLPNRLNIIVTSKDIRGDGIVLASSPEEALEKSETKPGMEVFVIGGGEIFKEVIHKADRLYLTHIRHTFEADTFFPSWNPDEWNIIHEEEYQADEKNPYDFVFRIYERKDTDQDSME